MAREPTVRVLFVCTGNICRSPAAEGLFRMRVAEAGLQHAVEADSAGTHDYHVGEPPDSRAQQAARGRNVDLSAQRARQVSGDDFTAFDLILAMDQGHYRHLRRLAPVHAQDRIRLFLDFAPEAGLRDVPDPYYGGVTDFETAFDLIEAGVAGLLVHIRERLA